MTTGYAPDVEVLELLKRVRWEGALSDAPVAVTSLVGDGSDRRFYRLRQKDLHLVALVSPRKKLEGPDENDSYLRIGRHLHARGIPVPRIHWADAECGYFLLEDVGDAHLQRHANRGRMDRSGLYRRVLRLLVALHRRAPEGFEAGFCFDSVLYDPPFVYERELEYFRKAFLVGYVGLDVSADDLRPDFEALAESAGVTEGRWVIHRDFQSRNLMVHRNALRLIDFQGMRYGPPAYDLASLLLDPYVALPRGTQEDLVAAYWSAVGELLQCSRSRFQESYAAVRLCRSLQVLGAYGYLGIVKGKRQFLRYVPRALRQLGEWLNGPCRDRYPRLQRWVRTADRERKQPSSPSQSQTFA